MAYSAPKRQDARSERLDHREILMNKRSVVCAVAVAALAVAGCGSSSKKSTTATPTSTSTAATPAPAPAPSPAAFKAGYIAVRPRVNSVGRDLANTLRMANKLTDAQLAGRFRNYAGRTASALHAASQLRPPASLAADYAKALAGLSRFSSDLRVLAGVVAAHNATAARRDVQTLLRDEAVLTATGGVIRAKLGIPATAG
jgi:hypothetical protein